MRDLRGLVQLVRKFQYCFYGNLSRTQDIIQNQSEKQVIVFKLIWDLAGSLKQIRDIKLVRIMFAKRYNDNEEKLLKLKYFQMEQGVMKKWKKILPYNFCENHKENFQI